MNYFNKIPVIIAQPISNINTCNYSKINLEPNIQNISF